MDNQHQDFLKKKDEQPIQQRENSFSPVKSFTPPPSGIDSAIVQPKKNILQLMQERPIEERPAYFQPNPIQRLQALPEEERPESLQPNLIQKIQRKKAEEKQALQTNTENKLSLPEDIQAKMEHSFGTDFSNVELYEGSNASNIGAQAYTQGNQVHFAPGKFNPSSTEGQELIGHELTHVLQQRSGIVAGTTQPKGLPINDDASLEKEADEMGKLAAQGKVAQGKFGEGNENLEVVQRKEDEKEPDYNALAKQLYDAIYGLQTDEDAVYSALKKLNRNATYIEKLKTVYKNLYQADLVEDIDGDFDFGSYNEVMVYLTPLTPSTEEKTTSKTNQPAKKTPERPDPSNDLSITSNVGVKNPDPKKTAGKKYNSPEDVRKVQDQLYSLGYFAPDKYEKEKIDLTEEKSEIPVDRIKETIAAIKEFQKIVRSAKNPDGVLSATGNDIQFLSSAVQIPDKKSIEEIKSARTEFKVTYISGEEELKKGISKEVGNTSSGNVQDDLKRVQIRLNELGYLKSVFLADTIDSKTKKVTKPGESPDKIVAFYNKDYPKGIENIKAKHLPQTISAIKKFQSQMVSKWINKNSTAKFPNLIGNNFTEGLIKNDDASFKVLKDYKKYTVSYTGIDGKSNQSDSFTNFSYAATSNSLLTTNIEGVSYLGKQKSIITGKDELKSLGLDETYAKILFYISTHEGKFDAINTWDKAIFSYGFIQFAGGKDRGLRAFLAYFKEHNPNVFKERFQKYGIDAEYSVEKDGSIKNTNIIATNEKGEILRNDAAELYINNSVILYGVFLKAAQDKEVQKMQILTANKMYVSMAKNSTIRIKSNVLKTYKGDKKTILSTYTGPNVEKYKKDKKEEFEKLSKEGRTVSEAIDIKGKAIDYLSSEKGLACVLNLCINEGNIKAINKGLSEVFNKQNFSTSEELKNYSDIEKLKTILTYSTIDTRISAIITSSDLSGTK